MTVEACRETSSVVEIHDAPRRMPSVHGGEEYWKEKAEYWKKRSIYKVPGYMRDMKSEAYQPQVVSLGPYHHDKEWLKLMEEHKPRALCCFLKRSGKSLVDLQKALSEVLDHLMDCYDQLDEKWRNDRDAFLQLMILDGAFTLEILQTWTDSCNDYPANDPIFGDHGKLYIMPAVRRDMLMLENQLPMLVLDKLVDGSEKGKEFFNKLIFKFCSPSTQVMDMGERLHLLDVFRKSLLLGHQSNSTRETSKVDNPVKLIRSATELREAGIRFKTSTTSLKDITFSKGILRLPTITVDDATESNFLNLVAFERLHVGIGNEVSSYVCLMDEIIDNENDVALLHRKGIISNAIGCDKAMAELFNSLSKEVPLSLGRSLQKVHRDISKHCEQRYNKSRANLCHTYFRSPWTAVSLIAAIFLFALTIVQTVFTVLQYYQ